MTKRTVTYIDPASGWQYGFPKILPEDVEDINEWLVSEGYPREMLGFPCRYWEQKVNDDND